MIESVFKVLAVCLVTSAIILIIKAKSSEYAFVIALAAGIIVMTFVFKSISLPIREISQKLSDYGIKTEYFKVALKAVGLSYITDFVADICRESGQISLASKAELAGKMAIFLLSVPLLMSVLETAIGFVK